MAGDPINPQHYKGDLVMPETRIMHIHHAPKDWRERPEEFVYIGRAVPRKGLKESPFANPFPVAKHGRTLAIAHYDVLLRNSIKATLEDASEIFEMIEALKGKTLVCWCAPAEGVTRLDRPWCCHGQVLAQLAHELFQLSEATEVVECTCDRLGHPCEVHDCRGGGTDV